MNLEQAKAQGRIIFKSDLDFENTDGVKYILRPVMEGEEVTPGPTPGTVNCRDGIKARRKDGRILLGAGNSWLTAMKQATRKRLEDLQNEQRKKQELQRQQEKEAEVKFNQFMQFLQEKFEKEFEASLEPTSPELPVSE